MPLVQGILGRSPEGTTMLAALSRKHIVRAGRLGSGPALGPQVHDGRRERASGV